MINFRFRFSFIFIFIILLAFMLFVGGLAPYYLFYIFLLTLIVPLIHSLLATIKIQGTISIPKASFYVGNKVDIGYSIENKSKFSIPYIEIRSNISNVLTASVRKNTVLSLRPQSSFTRKDTIILNKRGHYQLGDISIITRDIFGFYSFQKTIAKRTSLLVYPKIRELSSLKIIASYQPGELLTHNSIFEDRTNISSLRDYQEGDPIKTIHWKLSAKKDQPIVKSFENRVDTNVIVFLESSKQVFQDDVNRRLEDKSVDIALSIISYCLNQHIQVILETQKEDKYIRIIGQDEVDLKPFLEELTKFNGNGSLKIETLITSQIDLMNKGSSIIIISPQLDKSLGAIGLELKAKGFHPIIIRVCDVLNNTGFIDSMIEKRLLQERIPVYSIDYMDDLKKALEVGNG